MNFTKYEFDPENATLTAPSFYPEDDIDGLTDEDIYGSEEFEDWQCRDYMGEFD